MQIIHLKAIISIFIGILFVRFLLSMRTEIEKFKTIRAYVGRPVTPKEIITVVTGVIVLLSTLLFLKYHS